MCSFCAAAFDRVSSELGRPEDQPFRPIHWWATVGQGVHQASTVLQPCAEMLWGPVQAARAWHSDRIHKRLLDLQLQLWPWPQPVLATYRTLEVYQTYNLAARNPFAEDAADVELQLDRSPGMGESAMFVGTSASAAAVSVM